MSHKINVPFADLWQVIYDSLRTNDQGLMQFIAQNTRAAPETALGIISMVQAVHLDESQIRKLYSVISPDKANPTDINTPLMLEVYLAFGGTAAESERGKTAFIGMSVAGSYHGTYLERKGGSNIVRSAGTTPKAVSSMLQTAGLKTQIAYSAEKLASE